MIIQWRDEFNTGNRLVDLQHHALFKAINTFEEALGSGADPAELDKLLAFLAQYVNEHFATEESLMAQSGFPGLALHAVEHNDLQLRVKFIMELRDQNLDLVPFEGMSRFLADWLQDHILAWDMALFDFLREHPLET